MSLLLKWIENSKKDIELLSHKNFYEVKYLGVSSKITKPNNSYQFYLVSPNDENDYTWYDLINRYCIEKEPNDPKHILSKLVRFIEKENSSKKKNDSETQLKSAETNKKQEIPESREDFQISYYMLKSKLAKIVEAETSVSDVTSEGNVKKIFDEKIVSTIVANEFLECWKFSKENPECGFSVELVEDNIFCWKILLSNFDRTSQLAQDLKILNDKFKVDYVELELDFHGKLYPNYPPLIKVITSNLKDSLAHRIANSKMTQLSYWTPTRGAQTIIFRTKEILQKWGSLETSGITEVKKKVGPSVSHMAGHLAKLSSLIDTVKEDDEIDRETEFTKFNIVGESCKTKIEKPKVQSKQPTNHWKAGTGYGHGNQSKWNPEEYVKLQKEKDKQISGCITKIVNELQGISNTSTDFIEVCKTISNSLLIPYLKQQFKQCTLLEMQNRENLFKLFTTLLEGLASENSIYLFDIKQDNESLYDVLKKYSAVISGATKMDNENEFLQMLNGTLEIIIFPMYDEYLSKKPKVHTVKPIIVDTIIENKEKSINAIYKEKLTTLRFGYSDILNTNFKPEYVTSFKKESGANWRNCQKRLSVELSSLIPEGQLPIDYEASVFLRVDEANPMIIRSLMTGPHDTPYESGCFIFDLHPTSAYPTTFTNCYFRNTGGKRFNPNLYADGKVCLSILGTWGSGNPSENWNEKTSSLLQVLISVQSLILIPEPFFNEPSYETQIGKPVGITNSKNYNNDIRFFTMCHAIRDFLTNPKIYPQYEDVVKLHFKLKKDRILETCQKWTDEAITSEYANKAGYEEVLKDIKLKIEKF